MPARWPHRDHWPDLVPNLEQVLDLLHDVAVRKRASKKYMIYSEECDAWGSGVVMRSAWHRPDLRSA